MRAQRQHRRTYWLCLLSLALPSDADLCLATAALTTGAGNPQSHTQSGNVFNLTSVKCHGSLIITNQRVCHTTYVQAEAEDEHRTTLSEMENG